MPLAAPSNFAVTVLSSFSIKATWVNEGPYQNIQVWRQKSTMDFDSGSVEPQVDEVLTGADSGKTATVIEVIKTAGTWAGEDAEGYIHLENCSGLFQHNENINGSIGGSNILTVNEPILPPGEWVLINNIDGSKNETIYANLDIATRYYCKVRGEIWEPPEESPDSDIDFGTTYGVLAKPTEFTVIAFSNFIEITFKENSTTEDDTRLERKVDAGGYSEYATIPPNVEFFRDESVTPGSLYTYQARSKEGISYSPYSDEDSATALSAPSAPATLTVVSGSKTDKTLRLAWDDVSGETGYKIEKSTTGVWGGEEKEIAVVGEDVLDYLVKDLDPSTEYWFRIRAYNGVGNSSYTYLTGTSVTTLASYIETPFEKAVRDPLLKPIYLVEIKPKKTLTGFTLVSGKTYTYELTIADRGIDYENVYEVDDEGDIVSYSEKANINDVEANASSFYCDYNGRKLYAHTSDGTNPSNFFIEGSFWLYFTNRSRIVFNGKKYLSLLSSENIPGIVHEIKPYFEGNYRTSDGTISLVNDKIEFEHYFDKINAIYTWDNAEVLMKMGFEDFTYSQFVSIAGGQVIEKACEDEHFTLQFSDVRYNFAQELILQEFNQDNFPNLVIDREDRSVPKCYGVAYDIVAACIDLDQQQWKFHDGRIYQVQKVLLDKTEITENTDYYVDYQKGIITIDRDGHNVTEDTLVQVTFIGTPDSANDPIVSGAEIFKHLLKTEYGLTDDELELDSIYETKEKSTDDLAVFLYQNEKYETIIRKLEHSLRAYTVPDGTGKLGLKYFQDSAPYNVRYIKNHQIFDYKQYSNPRAKYYRVNVYYQEAVSIQEWQVEYDEDLNIQQKNKNSKELDIYTYLSNSYDAKQLATTILTLINCDYVTFTMSILLYDRFPGEVIKFSRDRAYNANGTANEELMRILRAELSPSARQTIVIGEYI